MWVSRAQRVNVHLWEARLDGYLEDEVLWGQPLFVLLPSEKMYVRRAEIDRIGPENSGYMWA